MNQDFVILPYEKYLYLFMLIYRDDYLWNNKIYMYCAQILGPQLCSVSHRIQSRGSQE